MTFPCSLDWRNDCAFCNEVVKVPPQGQDVDTGTFVAGMIMNILGQAPIRMYRLSQFFADKPLPLLFPWSSKVQAAKFNDARAERVLDDLWAVDPRKVFGAVAHQVILRYQPDRSQVHVDTTSKSFYRVYEHQPDPQVPRITYGHSKDRRPDLKQLLFGVGLGGDGLLLLGEVSSGNRSDMTFNGHWIHHIREQLALTPEEFLLYVADSAVVTTENLGLLREYHMDILSRLPERFGLAETLMAQPQGAPPETWETVGVIREGQGKRAASYRVWQTEAELAGGVYRFLVVASSSLDKRHLKALERAQGREVSQFQKLARALEARSFTNQADAEAELASALHQWLGVYHRLTGWVESCQCQLPRPRRGRPKAGEKAPVVTRYRMQLALQPDEVARRCARERYGLKIRSPTLANLRDMSHGTLPDMIL